jgi:hypothetical protein
MHNLQLCDIVARTKDIDDKCGYNSVRIKCFLKQYVPPKLSQEEQKIYDMIGELNAEADIKENNNCVPQLYLIKCSPEQAEFISGAGVCGALLRIEDVTYLGTVEWNKEDVKHERLRYAGQNFSKVKPWRVDDSWSITIPKINE